MDNDQNNDVFDIDTQETWYAPLNKVTPLSKYLAMLLFVSLPFLGFWIGFEYKESQYITVYSKPTQNEINEETPEVDLIKITSPEPFAQKTSPLELSGEARGYWFFEASAPVVLVDWDGKIIAEGYVVADGDWMTEDFVSFSGELQFTSPYKAGDPDFMQKGTLIFKKANASGLPEHDDALEIPITFMMQTESELDVQAMFGFFTENNKSPNGTYASGLASDKQEFTNLFNFRKDVVVFDLIKDSYSVVASVGDGETLVGSGDFAGLPAGEFKWIDDSTLEYSVYSTLNPDVDEYGFEKNRLVEKRTISID